MKTNEVGSEAISSARDGSKLVTPGWLKARRIEMERLRHAREADPSATTSLLIVATQHPLKQGKFPGLEFEERLTAAASRYGEVVSSGGKAEVLASGNRHHDSKANITDEIALYDAAGAWLLGNGIEAADLHGKDWTDLYRPQGVYTGAAEIDVAAAGFKNGQRFRDAEYFCASGQATRATTYALAYGLPLTVTVRDIAVGERFHDNSLQTLVLNGLSRTIDPYGEGMLARLTQDRVPEDGNLGTSTTTLAHYSDLPWYK